MSDTNGSVLMRVQTAISIKIVKKMQLRINKNLFKFCSACGLRIVSRMIAVYRVKTGKQTGNKLKKGRIKILNRKI